MAWSLRGWQFVMGYYACMSDVLGIFRRGSSISSRCLFGCGACAPFPQPFREMRGRAWDRVLATAIAVPLGQGAICDGCGTSFVHSGTGRCLRGIPSCTAGTDSSVVGGMFREKRTRCDVGHRAKAPEDSVSIGPCCARSASYDRKR